MGGEMGKGDGPTSPTPPFPAIRVDSGRNGYRYSLVEGGPLSSDVPGSFLGPILGPILDLSLGLDLVSSFFGGENQEEIISKLPARRPTFGLRAGPRRPVSNR